MATRKSSATGGKKSATSSTEKPAAKKLEGKPAGKKTALKQTGSHQRAAGKSGTGTTAGDTGSARTPQLSRSNGLRDGAVKLVAAGDRIREGVRDMAVAAMDGASASTDAMRSVVDEIMGGASSVVADSMPKNETSPLREVVAGLTEAASVIADGGRKAAKKTVKTTKGVVDGGVRGGAAMRDTALRTTHDMLAAVEGFAKTVAGGVRQEIEHLVAEARTTGGRLEAPTRRAGKAAAERPGELVKETAETGMRMAIGTTSRLLTAAGGMLSGLGNSLGDAATGGSVFGGGGAREQRKSGKPTVGAKRQGVKTRPPAPRSRKT